MTHMGHRFTAKEAGDIVRVSCSQLMSYNLSNCVIWVSSQDGILSTKSNLTILNIFKKFDFFSSCDAVLFWLIFLDECS